MTQHYQRNTIAVLMFCPTCNKKTMHQVNDKRVGTCLAQHASGLSRAQEKAAKKKTDDNQAMLFEKGGAA